MRSALPYIRNDAIEALTHQFRSASSELRAAAILVDRQEVLSAEQIAAVTERRAAAKWCLARIDEALADPVAGGLMNKGGLQS